jgi:riboflavin synthase
VFTGIIEEIGAVQKTAPGRDSVLFWIGAETVLDGLSPDHSVSVSGVCLTVTEVAKDGFTAVAVSKTLEQSTLGLLRKGDAVNLERALRLGDRLGGHFVQGHVDGSGKVVSIRKTGDASLFGIRAPRDLMRYAVPRGSVAVDGVSLTIAGMEEDRFFVSVIPHTLQHTTFHSLKNESRVNLEMDFFGKYIERLCARRDSGTPKPEWID